MLETRSTYRLVTRFSTGQRHSTRLKLSRCRASCGIHILRQRYCTRLKLRHGLSARIRKCTRLRNGSTAAQRLYNTRQGRTARLLDTLYRHSSPAARQHGAAVQKYHIYQRQHITTSTRQQTWSSITARRQANDRQHHRHSSTAARRQANDRQRHRHSSPAPSQLPPAPHQCSTGSAAPYPKQKTGTAKHRRPGHRRSLNNAMRRPSTGTRRPERAPYLITFPSLNAVPIRAPMAR